MQAEKTDDVCCSGGAEGADLAWGDAARAHGQSVIHFGFRGHRSRAPSDEIITLTRDQLAVAEPFLEKANKTLRRRWPVSSEFVGNLLRRNYYQVQWSTALYAVSEIEHGLVKGGTSWAVQMMIDIHPDSRIYVFDQEDCQWYQWKKAWFPIIKPPRPSDVWAGVGTRNLNDYGTEAIKELFE